MTSPERFSRQRDIIPPERTRLVTALVVGVGAVGRQVATQLAVSGVGRLVLIDHDVVEEVNLGPQCWLEEDLGRPKVAAAAESCIRLNRHVEVVAVSERFQRHDLGRYLGDAGPGNRALFCCVDSIATRKHVWEAARGDLDFWADGRMTGEFLTVLSSDDPAEDSYYSTTLFAEDEAFVGPCTTRSTVFAAYISSGLMTYQFSRWLRGLAVTPAATLNLQAMDLFVDEDPRDKDETTPRTEADAIATATT